MPNYDFLCKKCENAYEELTEYDETGKYKDVMCPHCGSKKKTKLLSACNFEFKEPAGTSKWMNEATGHDYRYKHNQPKVRKEKEMARKMSHMGTNPYRVPNDPREGVHDNQEPIRL